ncbi:MAG: hypothetical protein ACI9OJ_001492, partial [Myxococcota bacterium]
GRRTWGCPRAKAQRGKTPVNLLAKTLKFMVSRFENHAEISNRVTSATALILETVSRGALGPKWVDI